MTTVNTQVYNADQSWHFTRIVLVGNPKNSNSAKLRVEIRRNAYDFQSFARVSRWDGNRWHEVHSMPIEACRCSRISYVTKGVTAEDFEADCKALLDVAMRVVLE